MVKRYFEFKENDLKETIKSFYLKDDLNPKVWDDFKINQDIREQLLQIAQDFFDSIDLDTKIQDIILTGSLANYNWSNKYSDFDLHILIDLSDVDDNEELVKKYVDMAKMNWNEKHDIKIEGFEVEVYIQDVDEPHQSSGVFSLLNNKWKIKPTKENFKIDESSIENKAASIMAQIDSIESEVDDESYDKFIEKIDKVWEKIKKLRKEDLYSKEKGAELSVGNLVFKTLRRNNYIEKIMELKKHAYDKQFK
jgi:DNA-binding Lrp family transcriptional regulator